MSTFKTWSAELGQRDAVCEPVRSDVPEAFLADAKADASRVLLVASDLLSRIPIRGVHLQDIACVAELSLGQVQQLYGSMHGVGAAILDYERSIMAAIQAQVRRGGGPFLDQVMLAFRLVGEGLERDVVMRAGVRLAQESKHAFPERRLEPTRTWDGFLADLLAQAQAHGELGVDVDIRAEVRLALREGLQVRDGMIARQNWTNARILMERIGRRRVAAMLRRSAVPDIAGQGKERR